MHSSDLRRVVESAGLSARGARLYLVGLAIGSAPASQYARRTAISRVTAYNDLERLARGGFFTVVRGRGGKCYAPIEPEEIALAARKNAEALERALPELRSLRGAAHRAPHVKFFEGWGGVKKVYEDSLSAGSEILNFANSAIVRRFWERYDEEYVAERARRGIRLRGIAPDDEEGRRVRARDRECLREIRLVPADEFDFNNEINIYDHKVAIVSFPSGLPSLPGRAETDDLAGAGGAVAEDLFGVIIESREVAETQRQIFEMAWRYAGTRRSTAFPGRDGRAWHGLGLAENTMG